MRFVKEYANYKRKTLKALYKEYGQPEVKTAIGKIDTILRHYEDGRITTDEAIWMLNRKLFD